MGGPGDDIYYHELYARPYPSTRHERFALEGPLPGWIRTVLDAVDSRFRTLFAGAEDLNDWGLAADLLRYRTTAEQIRALSNVREDFETRLAGAREELDLIAFRLSRACCAEQLESFQHLAGLPDSSVPDEGPPVYERGEDQRRRRGRGRGRPPV